MQAGTQEVHPRVWQTERARLFDEKRSSRDGPDTTTRKKVGDKGKTDHPAGPWLCSRHADNDVSFVVFILPGVTKILCDEMPS